MAETLINKGYQPCFCNYNVRKLKTFIGDNLFNQIIIVSGFNK